MSIPRLTGQIEKAKAGLAQLASALAMVKLDNPASSWESS